MSVLNSLSWVCVLILIVLTLIVLDVKDIWPQFICSAAVSNP